MEFLHDGYWYMEKAFNGTAYLQWWEKFGMHLASVLFIC